MIYDNPFNSSYTNPLIFNATGGKRLFLTPTGNIKGYAVTDMEISSFDAEGTISQLENISALNYAVKSEQSMNGILYQVDITFSIAGIKSVVTHLLDRLINNELTAILQDKNGRCWLLGFGEGFISEYEAKSDNAGYEVKMTTKQRAKPEQMSAAVMAELDLAEFDTIFTPAPIYSTPGSGGSGGSGGTNANFNVTTVITSNYTLSASDEFILLPAPNTVFLPATAAKGKRYIIKVDYDAIITPSTVKVTTGDIDKAGEFSLNSSTASIMVIYDGAGSWHTVAFSV